FNQTLSVESKLFAPDPRFGENKATLKLSCWSSRGLFLNEENDCEKNPRTTYRFRGFIKLLRTKLKIQLPALSSLNVPNLSGLRSSSMREQAHVSLTSSFKFGNVDSPYRNFSLLEHQLATKNFSQEKFIGKGSGYTEVYKGRLHDGQIVAVKQLARRTPEERIADFLAELGIVVHVSHPNITKMIVIVLMVECILFSSTLILIVNGKLCWIFRYKIALGIFEELMYPDYGCQRRIIHRDNKDGNILLTRDFEPQIWLMLIIMHRMTLLHVCDFGLAKWLLDNWTRHIHGIVDEKTDVFSFGVPLLELITGCRALDYSQWSLFMWAKQLLRKNKVRELIDPTLDNNFNSKQMKLMLLAAALCVQLMESWPRFLTTPFLLYPPLAAR
ncbi:Receptor-like cytosolic serine/threonine-protein kinase RBK2, partial [Bienertia sinuspersici]